MKKILWAVVLFLALSLLCAGTSLAQGPTLTPAVSGGTPAPDMEERLEKVEEDIRVLEHKQEETLRVSETRIGQLQTLLNWLGIVFVVFSVIFGGVAAVATWRQARQQQNLTGASIAHTARVSDVLDVVHKILRSRLLQVEQARAEIDDLRKGLETMRDVVNGLRAGIRLQCDLLESKAKELVQMSRHDFKNRANSEALNSFAKDFDTFKKQYPEEGELSGRCLYIRGVAALFNNQFQELEYFLNKVITLKAEPDEDEISFRKRLANAYYYLGLYHSNLGELDEAARFLEKAQELDLPRLDFLTRLVMAEVYTMSDQYKEAEAFLQEVEVGLNNLKQRQGNRLQNHQLRMLSRTKLMQANLHIIARRENWQEQASQYSVEACRIDPTYYYAPLTLGQIIHEIEGHTDTEQVKELFSDAYSRIQESGHLHFVTETRIRILLLMVSALCGRHGGMADERMVNNYLDEARLLRGDLPRIDNRVCTVFSPLSKRNVSSETIGSHIEKIREGTWSLHP